MYRGYFLKMTAAGVGIFTREGGDQISLRPTWDDARNTIDSWMDAR